ncbi:hypothetical protein [Tenacibaculum sp. 190524A02b]|uniref:hypothetical protein n=1 Tax=Tenacibaculum vairaonense TaxID=3137860 RepID=UPI0031FB0EBC
MKILKVLLLIVTFVTFYSCSNNSDNIQDDNNIPTPKEYNFSITQSLNDIQELDKVEFKIGNKEDVNINEVKWYVNNNSVEGYYDLHYTFSAFGEFKIKAEIIYYKPQSSNSETKIVEKTVTVKEKPKYLVTVKKVEVLAYSYFENFKYNQFNRCSMKSYFQIEGKDEVGGYAILHSSSENLENARVYLYDFKVMSWDISAVDYKIKVYKTGNYYPNSQWYSSIFKFYGASVVYGEAYKELTSYYLDLNPYRITKPSEVLANSGGLQIKLTLEWN